VSRGGRVRRPDEMLRYCAAAADVQGAKRIFLSKDLPAANAQLDRKAAGGALEMQARRPALRDEQA